MKLIITEDQLKSLISSKKKNNSTSFNLDYDAILVGGLDNRSGDYPISQQVELLKSGYGGNKKVKGFRYNTSTSEILSFLESHPNINIFLFSAGCSKAYELSQSPYVNKDKIFIIEPYAESKKVKQIVSDAVSNGVPSQNVFVGPSIPRGLGVVSGASGSGSNSHWGSLKSVGGKIR